MMIDQNDVQAQARCHRIGQTKSVKVGHVEFRFFRGNIDVLVAWSCRFGVAGYSLVLVPAVRFGSVRSYLCKSIKVSAF